MLDSEFKLHTQKLKILYIISHETDTYGKRYKVFLIGFINSSLSTHFLCAKRRLHVRDINFNLSDFIGNSQASVTEFFCLRINKSLNIAGKFKDIIYSSCELCAIERLLNWCFGMEESLMNKILLISRISLDFVWKIYK